MTILDTVTVDDTDGISDPVTGNIIIIKSGVIVSTETGSAAGVSFPMGASTVDVFGMVSSVGGNGIEIGSAVGAATIGSSVTIGQQGVVTSPNGYGIAIGAGNGLILNDGMIAARLLAAVRMVGNEILLVNNGTIMSGGNGIELQASNSTATSTLENFGLISGGLTNGGSAIQGSFAIDNITNRGTISGKVNLFDGDDIMDNDGGIVTGTISLGAGVDTLIGSDRREKSMGGSGDDSMEFWGGNDTYLAGNTEEATSDNNDELDGGLGIDTYDARGVFSAVQIRIQDERAAGSEIGIDHFVDFENAFGGSGNDTLIGDAGRNRLSGGEGNDTIISLDGNDRLFGGQGTDTLTGGTGRDTMTGGTEADIFAFTSINDSGTSEPSRDIITDFELGIDDIGLSVIDANSTLAGNQAFAFIGNAAFSSVAGQLRFTSSAAGQFTLIEADTTGDGKADFQITLFGAKTLLATDFVL